MNSKSATTPSALTALSTPATRSDLIRSLCTFRVKETAGIASLLQSMPLSPPDIERLKSARFRKLIASVEKSTAARMRPLGQFNSNQTRAAKRLDRVTKRS